MNLFLPLHDYDRILQDVEVKQKPFKWKSGFDLSDLSEIYCLLQQQYSYSQIQNGIERFQKIEHDISNSIQTALNCVQIDDFDKIENTIYHKLFINKDFSGRARALAIFGNVDSSVFYEAYQSLKSDSNKIPLEFATKDDTKEIISYSIIYGFTDILIECVQCKKQKPTIDKLIDEFIETAIMYERHEITAFLLDYKNKNGLYHDVNWEL